MRTRRRFYFHQTEEGKSVLWLNTSHLELGVKRENLRLWRIFLLTREDPSPRKGIP